MDRYTGCIWKARRSLSSEHPNVKQGRVCLPALGSTGTAQELADLSPLVSLTVKRLKPVLHTAATDNEQTSNRRTLLCLPSHCQTYRHLGKTATVRDQTWPCVHWLRCGSLSAFVGIRSFLNNKNWTVIKLGTCKGNVYRQLSVT